MFHPIDLGVIAKKINIKNAKYIIPGEEGGC